MTRKIIIIALLSIVLFQSSAFAFEADGEIMFRDALYGAAIGGLVGSAAYLGDREDFGSKLSSGVIIGTLLGLAYGVMETNTFVELKDNKIKVAFPTPGIVTTGDDVRYTASLFRARF